MRFSILTILAWAALAAFGQGIGGIGGGAGSVGARGGALTTNGVPYWNAGDNLSLAGIQAQFKLAVASEDGSAAIIFHSGSSATDEKQSGIFQTAYGWFLDMLNDDLSAGTHNFRFRRDASGAYQWMVSLQNFGDSTGYLGIQMYANSGFGVGGVSFSTVNPASTSDYPGAQGFFDVLTDGRIITKGTVALTTNITAALLTTRTITVSNGLVVKFQ